MTKMTMTTIHYSAIINYIKIEFKRTGIVFLHTLTSIFAMVLIMSIVAAGSVCLLEKKNAYEPVVVALCTEDKGTRMTEALHLVSSMKSLEKLCSFEYMDEDEAVNGIRSGKVDCALVFPSDFFKDINTGINTPARVVFNENGLLGQEIFKEIIGDAVSMIDTAEAGIYAVTYASADYEMKIARKDMEYLLTKMFAFVVLKRDALFIPFVYGFTGSLGLWDYYGAAAVFMIVLLTGLFFSYLYAESNGALNKKLSMIGITPTVYSAVKTFVMGMVIFILLVFVSAILSWTGNLAGVSVNIFYFDFLPSYVLISFSIAAFFHFIYSIGSSAHTGKSILFIVELLLILLSGTVLPVVFFGSEVVSLIRILPGTVWFECLSKTIDGSVSYMTMIYTAIYGIIFYIIGTVLQWKKLL
ncbi:MAG: ABC transporter permease [Lachnospiraceae bacterium]|nr:ABC transporter permease [Lachnospiraceae bacterium]